MFSWDWHPWAAPMFLVCGLMLGRLAWMRWAQHGPVGVAARAGAVAVAFGLALGLLRLLILWIDR